MPYAEFQIVCSCGNNKLEPVSDGWAILKSKAVENFDLIPLFKCPKCGEIIYLNMKQFKEKAEWRIYESNR